jgi:hypothetical protein
MGFLSAADTEHFSQFVFLYASSAAAASIVIRSTSFEKLIIENNYRML